MSKFVSDSRRLELEEYFILGHSYNNSFVDDDDFEPHLVTFLSRARESLFLNDISIDDVLWFVTEVPQSLPNSFSEFLSILESARYSLYFPPDDSDEFVVEDHGRFFTSGDVLKAWDHLKDKFTSIEAIEPAIVQILQHYGKTVKPKSSLVFSDNYGGFTETLIKAGISGRIVSFIKSDVMLDIYPYMYPDKDVNWLENNNLLSWLSQTKQTFDLILAFPEFLRNGRKPTNLSNITSSDYTKYIETITASLELMSTSGKSIVLLPHPDIVLQISRHLDNGTIQIEALFSVEILDSNVLGQIRKFDPETNDISQWVSFDNILRSKPILAVLSHSKQSRFYLAQIGKNFDQNIITLKTITSSQKAKESKIPQVKLDEFLQNYFLIAYPEIANYYSNKSLKPHKFIDIAKFKFGNFSKNNKNILLIPFLIEIGDNILGEVLLPVDNTFYRDGWLVKVNETIADPTYLMLFLNSPIGYYLRYLVAVDFEDDTLDAKDISNVAQLHAMSLRSLIVFLPDIDIQRRIAESYRKLVTLKNELTEVSSQLWNAYDTTSPVFQEIETLIRNNDDEIDNNWIASLPTPLASVFWRAMREEKQTQIRHERMLFAFEALAQFTATILMSAFSGHLKPDIKLSKPTFGTWVMVCQNLMKAIKQEAGSSQKLLACNFDAFDTIFNQSRFLPLIQKTNLIRNNKSHGSSKVPEDELHDLEKCYQQWRGLVQRAWRGYMLISPTETSRKQGGVIHQQISIMMGTAYPFRIETIELSEQLESDQLYMYSPNNRNVLKLIPTILVVDADNRANSFFYNKLNNGELEFKSYEDESSRNINTESNKLLRLRNLVDKHS